MKISTKGRYALRMMLDLAKNQKSGYISLKDIAERQGISKKYLEQIVSENVIREMFSNIDANAFENVHIISSSTMKENGMDAFSKLLSDLFINGYVKMNDEVVITNIRHKEALMASEESLQKVLESIDMCMPEDFFSIDLMSAYSSLGYIIGEEVGDDLVQEIFTKFCMGK